MQLRGLRTPVVDRDFDQKVLWIGLGIFDEHVEIAVGVKHPRIEQFVLKLFPRPPPVRFHHVATGEFLLRILVEVFHVRVGRRAVQVEVVLLDVLAVIGLAVGQAKQTFFQDRVPAIPQSNREAELLLVIGDPGQTIFSPVVGARLVVTKVVPRIPVGAVVFANCTPLPLTQIRPPLLPWDTGLTCFIQALLLIGFDLSNRRPLF